VAALAEAKFGAGRGHRVVLYVTVGTGIGGGLVVDNKLYAGHRVARTELGHLRPGLQATSVDDIVEAQASGLGIAATVRRILSSSEDHREELALLEATGLASLEDLTAREIAVAAAAGEPYAVAAFDRATQALGWAIAQTITLTAAEVVVIGGGVSLAGEELFFEPVRRHAAVYAYPPLADAYEIVPAALGEEVVVHGGLVLAAGA
jgi:glucokinase